MYVQHSKSVTTPFASATLVQVDATGLYRNGLYRREFTRVNHTSLLEIVGYKDITDSHRPPPLTASSATLTPSLPLAADSTVLDNLPLITFTYLTRYISRNAPQARPQRDQDHLPPSHRW
jgi:hypothetical protein